MGTGYLLTPETFSDRENSCGTLFKLQILENAFSLPLHYECRTAQSPMNEYLSGQRTL